MSQPLDDVALDQLFRTARTYNGYDDRPVSIDQLHAIWELMKFGPTSANMLPSRLIWIVSDEAKAKLATFAGGTNGAKILSAPASVIIGMDVDFHQQLSWLFPHSPDAPTWFSDAAAREVMALRNSSLQGGYFIMAARALGLDTGPMSGFDNAGVDAAYFGDTPNVKSNFISTIGYGDPATIFDRLPRPPFETFNTVL
jgi:3-hydroxypropanoate dehydrogenase